MYSQCQERCPSVFFGTVGAQQLRVPKNTTGIRRALRSGYHSSQEDLEDGHTRITLNHSPASAALMIMLVGCTTNPTIRTDAEG
jgi:hypothetical protein